MGTASALLTFGQAGHSHTALLTLVTMGNQTSLISRASLWSTGHRGHHAECKLSWRSTGQRMGVSTYSGHGWKHPVH